MLSFLLVSLTYQAKAHFATVHAEVLKRKEIIYFQANFANGGGAIDVWKKFRVTIYGSRFCANKADSKCLLYSAKTLYSYM